MAELRFAAKTSDDQSVSLPCTVDVFSMDASGSNDHNMHPFVQIIHVSFPISMHPTTSLSINFLFREYFKMRE